MTELNLNDELRHMFKIYSERIKKDDYEDLIHVSTFFKIIVEANLDYE